MVDALQKKIADASNSKAKASRNPPSAGGSELINDIDGEIKSAEAARKTSKKVPFDIRVSDLNSGKVTIK